ncbi:hypothetical protein FXO37_20469 [Capsicum annuum]|nr:hypothetical protein FXO37_20469 [Capsicum annuum]
MSRSAGEEDEKTKLDLDGDRKELGGKRRAIDLPDLSYALLSPMKCVYNHLSRGIITTLAILLNLTLTKKNRKPPPTMLLTLKEKSATPPPSGAKNGKFYGVVGSIGGSKSVNSVKKRIGGLMTRKSMLIWRN